MSSKLFNIYIYKYFIIFLRFFAYFNVVSSKDDINVGTVLFTKDDAAKKCWSNDQIALLRARLIYQDILPQATLVDLKNDEFLNEMINYFRLGIDKVKSLTNGQTQKINLMAMCDVLGGYFRSILIPLTKRAYYSGTINYNTTQKVAKFYDDIKLFLHTDGKNWAPPSDLITNRFIRCDAPLPPQKNKNLAKSTGNSCDKICFIDNNGFIFIPTPYFDSKKNPTAIALPFKQDPLRNLEHENAVYCLSNFFSTAEKCLQEKKASSDNIRKFKRDFEHFLDTDVYPHLTDEKIYPAFGGIIQVKNEINKKNSNIVKREIAKPPKTNNEISRRSFFEDIDDPFDYRVLIILIISLCVVTFLWLCITFAYCRKITKKPTESKAVGGTPDSTNIEIEIDADNTKNARKNVRIAGEPQYRHKARPHSRPISKSGRCEICRQNFIQYGAQMSHNKPCPKCKRKHCRCVENIWSSLSNCAITYPRIFSQKNTATLLQEHVENEQTNVSLCPLCKTPTCKHLNQSEKSIINANLMVEMAQISPKGVARNIQSAPVTVGKTLWRPETPYETNKSPIKENVCVFGYDFETSTSDSSSTDDSSSDTS